VLSCAGASPSCQRHTGAKTSQQISKQDLHVDAKRVSVHFFSCLFPRVNVSKVLPFASSSLAEPQVVCTLLRLTLLEYPSLAMQQAEDRAIFAARKQFSKPQCQHYTQGGARFCFVPAHCGSRFWIMPTISPWMFL